MPKSTNNHECDSRRPTAGDGRHTQIAVHESYTSVKTIRRSENPK